VPWSIAGTIVLHSRLLHQPARALRWAAADTKLNSPDRCSDGYARSTQPPSRKITEGGAFADGVLRFNGELCIPRLARGELLLAQNVVDGTSEDGRKLRAFLKNLDNGSRAPNAKGAIKFLLEGPDGLFRIAVARG